MKGFVVLLCLCSQTPAPTLQQQVQAAWQRREEKFNNVFATVQDKATLQLPVRIIEILKSQEEKATDDKPIMNAADRKAFVKKLQEERAHLKPLDVEQNLTYSITMSGSMMLVDSELPQFNSKGEVKEVIRTKSAFRKGETRNLDTTPSKAGFQGRIGQAAALAQVASHHEFHLPYYYTFRPLSCGLLPLGSMTKLPDTVVAGERCALLRWPFAGLVRKVYLSYARDFLLIGLTDEDKGGQVTYKLNYTYDDSGLPVRWNRIGYDPKTGSITRHAVGEVKALRFGEPIPESAFVLEFPSAIPVIDDRGLKPGEKIPKGTRIKTFITPRDGIPLSVWIVFAVCLIALVSLTVWRLKRRFS